VPWGLFLYRHWMGAVASCVGHVEVFGGCGECPNHLSIQVLRLGRKPRRYGLRVFMGYIIITTGMRRPEKKSLANQAQLTAAIGQMWKPARCGAVVVFVQSSCLVILAGPTRRVPLTKITTVLQSTKVEPTVP